MHLLKWAAKAPAGRQPIKKQSAEHCGKKGSQHAGDEPGRVARWYI